MKPRSCASLLLVGLPLVLSGQNPIVLGKPDAEFKEPFSRIEPIRELKDGRVLVVDQREVMVKLVDFKSGIVIQVGRIGSGPGEFLFPGQIVALPGDSSALHDARNGRYLLINPDGRAGNTFRLDDAVMSHLGSRGSIPRGTDARGRIFFEGPSTGSNPDGGAPPPDSAPVMRYDRQTTKLDTVAFVHLAKGNTRITAFPGGGVSIMVGAQGFPARDTWGPMPDGGIAIARVSDYHIDRYSASGARASGRPMKVNPVPVTEAEKDELREERRAAASPLRGKNGSIPSGLRPNLPDPEFPAFKPPFSWSGTFARPNGELWVRRSGKAGEPHRYDIFSTSGENIAAVVLPQRTRLVGFGREMVYLARVDDDDLQYLQRYVLPGSPPNR
jgi:hypothetical protein